MKPKNMQRVVGGRRYNVSTATLIASDVYWDGNSMERSGRNTFLYKTRGGAFFIVALTKWQGERDSLDPVTDEEAIDLYEKRLTEHEMDYEAAFDTVVDEAVSGRPSLFGQPMKRANIWLPEDMIDWLKNQPEHNMSDTVRRLAQAEMSK